MNTKHTFYGIFGLQDWQHVRKLKNITLIHHRIEKGNKKKQVRDNIKGITIQAAFCGCAYTSRHCFKQWRT